LQDTDAVVGCLDAMRPRVLADLISARQNKPYINGGVNGLIAQYNEFTSTNLVETYGASVAKDTKVVSCQEDGDVPVSSIVLTNALVGAFQAISAIQRLSGMPAGVSTIAQALWPENTDSYISGA
jgi:hypothetical protein